MPGTERSTETITTHTFLDLLTALVEKSSQRQVARDLGISSGWLHDILHGRRPVPAEVARKMGFERKKQVVFVRVDSANQSKNMTKNITKSSD